MKSTRTILLLVTLALLSAFAPLRAQDVAFNVGAGAALPIGGAAERRDVGPAAVVSAEFRKGEGWGLRLDGEWSLLNAPPAPAGQSTRPQYADVRIYGASLNGILRYSGEKVAQYVLVGIGAYRLQEVGQSPSPYGTTGALQFGLGIDGNLWERINPFAEMRTMLHVTDYASSEFSPTVYWPIHVGVRIR